MEGPKDSGPDLGQDCADWSGMREQLCAIAIRLLHSKLKAALRRRPLAGHGFAEAMRKHACAKGMTSRLDPGLKASGFGNAGALEMARDSGWCFDVGILAHSIRRFLLG